MIGPRVIVVESCEDRAAPVVIQVHFGSEVNAAQDETIDRRGIANTTRIIIHRDVVILDVQTAAELDLLHFFAFKAELDLLRFLSERLSLLLSDKPIFDQNIN